MWATELRSIDHQLGIRQIGKPGALRTLEVFAAFPVEADQVLHAAVGVESDRDLAPPEQEAADGAGAGDIIGHVAAVDQLHRQRRDPVAEAHRLQDEGKAAAVAGAAYQAEAAAGRVPRKQRDVGFGQAVDRLPVLPDHFDAHALRRTRQRRKGEEQAAAISTESLGFDGAPGPLRRADVDVGDVLVSLRDLGQHRRVVAVGRFHIPAREIAADRGPAATVPRGVDQQQNAEGRPRMVACVAEARETFGYLTQGHAPEPAHPVVSRTPRKAARQKIGYGIKIGYSYLAASDHAPNSLVDPGDEDGRDSSGSPWCPDARSPPRPARPARSRPRGMDPPPASAGSAVR